MNSSLVNCNVVIVARQFNPSIFHPVWLDRQGLIEASDVRPGTVYTDLMVNVRTETFELLVTPEQCQLAPLSEEVAQQELIQGKVGKIVHLLPHTPFIAVGMNFVWSIHPQDVAEYVRQHFEVKQDDLYNFFNTPDSRFGAYLSRDILGCRLKLEIRPMVEKSEDHKTRELLHKKEYVQFAFNFHLDLAPDSAVRGIDGMLANWEQAKSLAKQLTLDSLKAKCHD